MRESRRRRLCRAIVSAAAFSRDIDHAVTRHHDAAYCPNNVVAILTSLLVHGPQRPGALAALTHLSSGGTSNLLGRLEGLGAVRRSTSREVTDGRAVLVELTPAGREQTEALCSTIVRGLQASAPQLKEVAEVLERAGGVVEPPAVEPIAAELAAEPRARLALAGASLGIDLLAALRSTAVEGLTDDPSANLVLAILEDTGGCRPRHLGDLLGLSSGGVSRLIDRLAEAGLARRVQETGGQDGRAVLIEITEAGVAHLDTLLAATEPQLGALLAWVRRLESELHIGV